MEHVILALGVPDWVFSNRLQHAQQLRRDGLTLLNGSPHGVHRKAPGIKLQFFEDFRNRHVIDASAEVRYDGFVLRPNMPQPTFASLGFS